MLMEIAEDWQTADKRYGYSELKLIAAVKTG